MNIHPISNGYSTAYLVTADGAAMLVDASTPAIAPKVLAKLAELDAQLRLIVLTHYHFDHVGAADPLRRATGARVAIHQVNTHPDPGAITQRSHERPARRSPRRRNRVGPGGSLDRLQGFRGSCRNRALPAWGSTPLPVCVFTFPTGAARLALRLRKGP
jgi:glyoxylase-like metal-dependent hydrolase (beta-lactamase superfamily II)